MKLSAVAMLKRDRRVLLWLWVIVGVLSRILPHFPNVTAMTSLSLLAGARFSRVHSIAVILLTLFLSDAVLAYAEGYPVVSAWSLFTYSGLVGVTLFCYLF